MDKQKASEAVKLHFTYGSFEGFNFRSQSGIKRNLTGEEVVNWNHDRDGEAEFWPSGDRREVSIIFPESVVTGSQLFALDALLTELGNDETESVLKIYYLVVIQGYDLHSLSAAQLEDLFLDIFIGENFPDIRKEAAYQLFEMLYPEAYAVWEKCTCDGLIFDVDRFLDSPQMSTHELRLGDEVVLLVAPE